IPLTDERPKAPGAESCCAQFSPRAASSVQEPMFTHTAWYPDELAHAGPEHLDEAYVAGYDRKAGPESGEDLALLRELGLGERHTLVDLGAGTGSLAL